MILTHFSSNGQILEENKPEIKYKRVSIYMCMLCVSDESVIGSSFGFILLLFVGIFYYKRNLSIFVQKKRKS